MNYKITTWTIKDLVDTYAAEKLILNPPYQRKFIWSLGDQRTLIDSILKGHPIPNFFFLEKKDGVFEIVDGQQRTRTIIGFYNQLFTSFDNKLFDSSIHKNFLSYKFPVTILSDIQPSESIEEFYSMVNGSGIHLNRPELMTAEHYDTTLLKLVNELAASSQIKKLELYSDGSLKRMNDIDFTSELVILLKEGHTDKKLAVDQAFSTDITSKQYDDLKILFNNVMGRLLMVNSIFPIKKTRYKQRNDFYTLVSFVKENTQLSDEALVYIYKLLVLIGGDIRPTQEKCLPYKEYAINCVSQSNSKLARDERLKFLKQLFLNSSSKPNRVQVQILSFYGLETSDMKTVQGFRMVDIEKLSSLKSTTIFEA